MPSSKKQESSWDALSPRQPKSYSLALGSGKWSKRWEGAGEPEGAGGPRGCARKGKHGVGGTLDWEGPWLTPVVQGTQTRAGQTPSLCSCVTLTPSPTLLLGTHSPVLTQDIQPGFLVGSLQPPKMPQV